MNNKEIADLYRTRYHSWKKESLENSGFFVIFNGFADNKDENQQAILQKITGGALKLYIFLGIKSKNYTGESFYSIKSLAKYFGKSERTINNWFRELESLNLIYKIQLQFNEVSHTFLQIYETNERNNKKNK